MPADCFSWTLASDHKLPLRWVWASDTLAFLIIIFLKRDLVLELLIQLSHLCQWLYLRQIQHINSLVLTAQCQGCLCRQESRWCFFGAFDFQISSVSPCFKEHCFGNWLLLLLSCQKGNLQHRRAVGLQGWSLWKNLCVHLFVHGETYHFIIQAEFSSSGEVTQFHCEHKVDNLMFFSDWALSVFRVLFHSVMLLWNKKTKLNEHLIGSFPIFIGKL